MLYKVLTRYFNNGPMHQQIIIFHSIESIDHNAIQV